MIKASFQNPSLFYKELLQDPIKKRLWKYHKGNPNFIINLKLYGYGEALCMKHHNQNYHDSSNRSR